MISCGAIASEWLSSRNKKRSLPSLVRIIIALDRCPIAFALPERAFRVGAGRGNIATPTEEEEQKQLGILAQHSTTNEKKKDRPERRLNFKFCASESYPSSDIFE
eukprot:scaffold5143_cov231-Pinguiococcus_pyrenoidosus.AAC.11